MKAMKKVLAIVICMALTLSLCVTASAAPAAKAPSTSKFVKLTWMMHGSNVKDDKAVMAKVNAILKKKINAELEMKWEGWGTYDQKQTLALNGGAPTDIYFTCSWTVNTYQATAKKGAFVRLDDPKNNLLASCAPNLFKTLPQVLAQAATTDGKKGKGIYAIPTYKEIAQQYHWLFNKRILDKYKIDASQITSNLKDLEPLLKKIKEGEGKDFYPINCDYTVWMRAFTNTDQMENKLLVGYAFDPVHPSKSAKTFFNRNASPEYKAYCETMHKYYEAGYINPAAITNNQVMSETWQNTRASGQWAFDIFPYVPGDENSLTDQYNYKFTVKPVQAGIISTTSARGAMNAVSVTSKNPDRAVMLLNLVNTDPELRTLLAYGVEGIHYTKDDGRIVMKPNNGFAPWVYGMANVNILPLKDSDPADKYSRMFPKFNKAEGLPILGYAPDFDPVKTQMATLNNLADQYNTGLITGASNPATVLVEFNKKLKDGGIDAVIAEVNKQLNAFLTAK
jgi:putative aldouronate transport system substrate-binding protein